MRQKPRPSRISKFLQPTLRSDRADIGASIPPSQTRHIESISERTGCPHSHFGASDCKPQVHREPPYFSRQVSMCNQSRKVMSRRERRSRTSDCARYTRPSWPLSGSCASLSAILTRWTNALAMLLVSAVSIAPFSCGLWCGINSVVNPFPHITSHGFWCFS